MTDRYRVGRQCPHNIYLGDEPVGHGQGVGGCTSAANAAQLVADANAGRDLPEQLATMTAVARRLRHGWQPNYALGELTGDWWHRIRDVKEPMTDAERLIVAALDEEDRDALR